MSVALPAKPRRSDLLGPVVYTVSSGADVWPGIGWSGKPFVRVLGGLLGIFLEFRRWGKAAVSVGGWECVTSCDEWKASPAYEG